MKTYVLAIASFSAFAAIQARPAEPIMAPTLSAQAVPLTGTLFNSDLERARIDAAQRKPKNAVQTEAPAEERYQIHGWVRRDDGDTTVWVDGQMVGPVLSSVAAKVGAGIVGGPSGHGISIHQQVTVRTENAVVAKPLQRPKKRKAARAP